MDTDTSTWLTKAETAAALSVTEKQVQRFDAAGRIQSAWRRRERGPDVKVYHPDDVDRLRQERRPGLAPFVLPADGDHPRVNGRTLRPRDAKSGPGAGLAIPAPDGAGWLQLVELAREFMSRTSRTRPLWVGLDEAVAITGLNRWRLLQYRRLGKLEMVRVDRTWRVRTRDLEAL